LQIAAAKRQQGLEIRTEDAVEAVIRAQKNIVDAVPAGGTKIYGVTYPPLGGREYTEGVETMRVALNTWIRESGTFDAVADFERALRPGRSVQPLNVFRLPDTRDYAAVVASAFDLSVF